MFHAIICVGGSKQQQHDSKSIAQFSRPEWTKHHIIWVHYVKHWWGNGWDANKAQSEAMCYNMQDHLLVVKVMLQHMYGFGVFHHAMSIAIRTATVLYSETIKNWRYGW